VNKNNDYILKRHADAVAAAAPDKKKRRTSIEVAYDNLTKAQAALDKAHHKAQLAEQPAAQSITAQKLAKKTKKSNKSISAGNAIIRSVGARNNMTIEGEIHI